MRTLLDLSTAIFQTDRPVMVNLIVTRRCNLSCGYCTEYDKVSPPVPLEVLRERIDHLARLRTIFVALTGGEPLLHPDLVEVVAYVRARGMTPVLNTNGFLLDEELIHALGAAGLYAMQISVDGVRPNATTVKTLKPLRPKLEMLARHATFRVRVNSVLGSVPPEEAIEVARVAIDLGFDAKTALVREADGTPRPVDRDTRRAWKEIRAMRPFDLLGEDFQIPLLEGKEVDWKCRAGARFFHVCENGLVHLCAPRTGNPAKPLALYGVDDIRRAFAAQKSCAAACPVMYAHQASAIDRLRSQDGPDMTPEVGRRRRLSVVA